MIAKQAYQKGSLIPNEVDAESGSVECLGMTFDSDKDRRTYFLDRLEQKLKDTAFRNIPGFPIGTDADILRFSDPPYFTVCPNPFIEDFLSCYGKPYNAAAPYIRGPLAVDVSEGKTDPIYTAHSYHTKVPHKATCEPSSITPSPAMSCWTDSPVPA